MKPKHQRLLFISISVIFLCLSVLMTLRAFKDNIVFFFSPSELASQTLDATQRLRIGGLVQKGTLVQSNNGTVTFNITDGNSNVAVIYQGMLPNLFREEQGVVAEGYLTKTGLFDAKMILAKHDEKYMPKEVVDALKKSGRWQEDATPPTPNPMP